jgi:hypothetical protein
MIENSNVLEIFGDVDCNEDENVLETENGDEIGGDEIGGDESGEGGDKGKEQFPSIQKISTTFEYPLLL